MNKLLKYSLLACCLLATSAVAQKKSHYTPQYLKNSYRGLIQFSGGIGVSYYMGDLREEPLKNLALGPNLNAGLTYRLLDHLSLRSELRIYNVGGSQVGAKKTQNNLSFRTTSADAHVGVQLDLLRYSRSPKLNAYVFAGLGLTYLNPSAKLDGKTYSLPPLKTEGVAYKRLVMVAPGGLGVMYRWDAKWYFGIELSGTYVNSDYFDDVSNKYVAFNDPTEIAARLADRRPELGLPPNQPGFIRGNPANKDIYIMLGLKAQYLFNEKKVLQRSLTKCNR